ncbi:MAG: hypothetical protein ACPGEA_02030 [Acholeplasmataceae bacterium]
MMFLVAIIVNVLFTSLRLFFIGYVIRLLFRNTKYGRVAVLIIVFYQLILIISDINNVSGILDFIASIISFVLYIFLFDSISFKSIKKYKGIDTSFKTKYLERTIVYAITAITWFSAGFIYVTLGGIETLFVLALVIMNIIIIIYVFKETNEYAYIIVGKRIHKVYQFDVPKKAFKVRFDSFLSSDSYILDYVGIYYADRMKVHVFMLPIDDIDADIFIGGTIINNVPPVLLELKKYQFVSITMKNKTPRVRRLK